jgi:hypothetical protein
MGIIRSELHRPLLKLLMHEAAEQCWNGLFIPIPFHNADPDAHRRLFSMPVIT